MGNLIVSLIILAVVSVSIARIVYEKRKGAKCVGCALGGAGCSAQKQPD
jgi:hypothetical protein